MVVPIIIGILILAIIVYTMIKIVKNVIMGLTLIFFALIAGYLIFGSILNPRSIPIIGPLLPQTPSSFDIITYIKGIFQNIEIKEVSRDVENKLLVIVANNGRVQVSNFTVFVDENEVKIINKPKDPLNSSQITVIQTDWDENFTKILVQTSKVNATYTKTN